LCNKPYSGTQVIADYGEIHMRTGDFILYTSADSVLQIAAHEEIIPLDELYSACGKAREIMRGHLGVGRIIARPFAGTPGSFKRTSNRHDYSLQPPGETMLDNFASNGYETISVGKIYDIFAGRGLSESNPTTGNADGMDKTLSIIGRDFNGLCFVNLVDFDMLYGHRRDVVGYAKALSEFDERLGEMLPLLRDGDLLILTADHGCDPGFSGTDHTREFVPMIMTGAGVKGGVNLGTRATFADIAATIQDAFGLEIKTRGSSFANISSKGGILNAGS
jgi:phosphopentomutase